MRIKPRGQESTSENKEHRKNALLISVIGPPPPRKMLVIQIAEHCLLQMLKFWNESLGSAVHELKLCVRLSCHEKLRIGNGVCTNYSVIKTHLLPNGGA